MQVFFLEEKFILSLTPHDEQQMEKPNIAIIGAGMTGVVCARNLKDAGYETIIFEKSRGIGGRMATRRTSEGLQFDHGAQYITAKNKHFQSFIDTAISAGCAAHWKIEEKSTFVGRPSMNSLLDSFVEGLSLKYNTEILRVQKSKHGWMLSSENQNQLFDIVVLALPAPQIINLIGEHNPLSQELSNVEMKPCLTLMAAFPSNKSSPFITRREPNDDLAWISQDSAKPNRPSEITCWVAQAGDDWSTKYLEYNKDEIAQLLSPMLCERLSISSSELLYSSAHRWRYSKVTRPLGNPFMSDDSETLYVGGDWTISARVEGAWESGTAIARSILEYL